LLRFRSVAPRSGDIGSSNLGDRRCAFCGRPRGEVKKLVAGPSVFICERCVAVCRQLLAEDARRTGAVEGAETPVTSGAPLGSRVGAARRPREVKERLDEYVIGQERAKRMLAVAVYNQLKRIATRGRVGDLELAKSNILLIGPPGTGKTHLARTLAKVIDVPFAIADATPLTQAGYVGEDVESVIAKLLRAAGGDVSRAETGIVYLDEIDKLAKRPGHDRDVSGEGVQQGLLKLLEGKRVQVRIAGEARHPTGDTVEVDTSNVLFIGGGAFDGMARAVEENRRGEVGFRAGGRAPAAAALSQADVTPDVLHSFGFLPEFVGRFPVLVTLEALDEASLVDILVRPKDALMKQYARLFAMDGARLEWTHGGLLAVARRALERATGARGLRAVLEELLLDAMYDLSGQRGARFVIDEHAVARGSVARAEGGVAAA
jgi:ATP-dependent Clp protease ATP-binding subunit ClpX